ncbi:glycosyltransferase family 39 protein [Patescibacteria group bacterium]
MRLRKTLILIFFASIYLFLSVKDLYIDVINPDGINWHTRTQIFTEALWDNTLSDTFQSYHPGTTLMWISGPLSNAFKNDVEISKDTFLMRDYQAKLSVVIFGAFIFALTLVVLWKLLGFKSALFYSIILTLEPFIIGMRRLYHLDYLMTSLLFLSFLLILFYTYKSSKWIFAMFAGLFLALSLLTKITAVIMLPALLVILLVGKPTIPKKIVGILVLTLSTLIFIYALFPPIWKNPVKSIPKYYEKIIYGITDIGVEGKKEMGTSGKGPNVLLDEIHSEKDYNFYFQSIFMRFSMAGGFLLAITLGAFILRPLKELKNFEISTDFWINFWAVLCSIAIIIALTIPVKKSDRYIIIVFPFLVFVIANFLARLKVYFAVPLAVLYTGLVLFELGPYHPYYLAYSNPLLGGIEKRLQVLDNDPFGIGSYEAFNIAKKDMENSGYYGFYTISGSKSIKAISSGGRFSRFPSCVTDYVITFALDGPLTRTCTQKYELLDTVKINGFDYWFVYKRLNQIHESNYK